MKKDNSSETLLTFPCDFVIKIFGKDSDEFKSTVLAVLRKHVPQFSEDAIRMQPSSQGKFLAISVTLPIESKLQLDQIYQDLTLSPHVLMAL